METFLRNNPGVRWAIILVLLLGLVAEAILITNRLSSDVPNGEPNVIVVDGDDGEEVIPTPDETVELACRVATGVNLRGGPSVNNAVISVLDVDTTLTALGRNGDVPWLLVRAPGGQEGWVSSVDVDGNPLVECAGDLETLPERAG
jgi:hypothetical protein